MKKPKFRLVSRAGNVDIDSALFSSEEPSDENIVQNITATEQNESDEEEEGEE